MISTTIKTSQSVTVVLAPKEAGKTVTPAEAPVWTRESGDGKVVTRVNGLAAMIIPGETASVISVRIEAKDAATERAQVTTIAPPITLNPSFEPPQDKPAVNPATLP